MFEYIRSYYGVPAEIGRRVVVDGRPGIIVKDRGNYLGVNFDGDKPSMVFNVHPTWQVEYLEMGELPKPTKAQERYQRYLEYGDGFDSFLAYCRWDASPHRSWNGGEY